MRIILIRHGETDWNREGRWQGREDIPLNAEGKRQAEILAYSLKDLDLTAIYTSPLMRARETAETVVSFHSCPVIPMEGLIERDFGKLSGLLPKEREELQKSGDTGDIEPKDVLTRRALDTLKSISLKYRGEELVGVVTHGAWINALLAELSGEKIGSGKTLLKNASVSILDGSGEKISILKYNLTGEQAAQAEREFAQGRR